MTDPSEPVETAPALTEPIDTAPEAIEPIEPIESPPEPIEEVETAPEPIDMLREALDRAADGIGRLDVQAEDAAREHLGSDTTAGNRLGRLAEWGIWLSGAQGTYPPLPIARVDLLLFGDLPTGDHPVHLLVESTGARLKHIAVDPDSTLDAAVATAVAATDEAVDSGAQLLVISAALDDALPSSLVALLLRLSAIEVIGDSPDLDDASWADLVGRVRDRTHAARALEDDPVGLLEALDSPVLTALVTVLLRAAARRTPVLLDGAADTAAALWASRLAVVAPWWWLAASRSNQSATSRAMEALGLQPMLDLEAHLDAGAAALTALPLLRSAQALSAAVIVS